jgi:hypothetical protein
MKEFRKDRSAYGQRVAYFSFGGTYLILFKQRSPDPRLVPTRIVSLLTGSRLHD